MKKLKPPCNLDSRTDSSASRHRPASAASATRHTSATSASVSGSRVQQAVKVPKPARVVHEVFS